MFVALVAPEIMVLWAARQWHAANEITKLYAAYGWTRTHAFFALMGGFTAVTLDPFGTKHLERLSPYHLEPYLKCKKIRLTEAEIQDKSKGDGLAKALVILQTTWFIIQFFTRLALHLPVTELELVTLGFAFLNFATYFFWWSKPLNAKCVVEIEVDEEELDSTFHMLSTRRYSHDPDLGLSLQPTLSQPSPAHLHVTPNAWPTLEINPKIIVGSKTRAPHCMGIASLVEQIPRTAHRTLTSILDQFQRAISGSWFLGSEHPKFIEERHIPFYYGKLTPAEGFKITMVFTGLAIAFGALHCSAWAFPFPSHTDKLLWCISSLITTLSPIYGYIYYSICRVEFSRVRDNTFSQPSALYKFVTGRVLRFVLAYPLRLLYIIARMVLLVQMFALLRSTSDPRIFRTVQWINVIPHL